MSTLKNILIFGTIFALGAYIARDLWTTDTGRIDTIQSSITDERFKRHAELFSTPEVLKITNDIFVAIGFGIANSILLVGNDSAIVVDVMESYEAGLDVARAFRNVTDKPIKTLILTHHHTDHIGGGKAFQENSSDPLDVWAHITFPEMNEQVVILIPTSAYTRAMRQFGVYIKDTYAGIGPELRYGTKDYTSGIVRPNKFLSEKVEDVNIAGLAMRILHIPGETSDQIGVWIPDKKTFLCADDIYTAFPNLYAIRGTIPRNVMDWVRSLDTIIELEPEFLIPSHSRPVTGVEQIKETLTIYRDGIQFVHDQTVRYINDGLTPKEAARRVKLPENLASHPYLQEFYGTVEWSSRGIASSLIGWFSGDPVDLSPLTMSEKSTRMAALAGGVQTLTTHADTALKQNDFQWALELATYALSASNNNKEAKRIKIEAMASLAELQRSICGRNYYLTCVYEEIMETPITVPPEVRQSSIYAVPIELLLLSLPGRFLPEVCAYPSLTVVFEFTDTSQFVSIQIRNSIAIATKRKINTWDIMVVTKSLVLKDIIAANTWALTALTSGELKVEGDGNWCFIDDLPLRLKLGQHSAMYFDEIVFVAEEWEIIERVDTRAIGEGKCILGGEAEKYPPHN
ncbi:hypothetical protein ScPMuIL_015077 [Solemya velum]